MLSLQAKTKSSGTSGPTLIKALAITVGMIVVLAARAQEAKESEPESSLKEVTVTTTRLPRPLSEEATSVDVLSADELEESIAGSPGDVSMLLNETPGLHVQMTSPGLGAANVRIEGLEGRYSQILADGLPLYGGQAGSTSFLQIPPLDLGQVEVIKGVASALYGASALGGVVNFVSRRPDGSWELLVNETRFQETDAALWLSSPATKNGWSYSLLTSGNLQSAHDVDDDGWADVPAFRRALIRPRLYWSDEAGRELYLTAGATFEDRTGGTVAGGRVPSGDPNGTSFIEALDTKRFDGGLTGRFPFGPNHSLTVRASINDRDLDQTFGPVFEPTHYRTVLTEVAFNGTSGPQRWVIGTAFQQDQYRDQAFPAFDFTYNVPGLFAQDDYEFSESYILSGSARIDHHNQYGTFFSPRLATLWRPGGAKSPWSLRVALGTGFYAPTPITEDTEATGLSRVLPLMGIRAERALGGSVDLGRTWITSYGSIQASVTAFGSRVANAVNLVQVSAVPPLFAFANDPQPTQTLGTELLVHWVDGPIDAVFTHGYLNSTEFEPDAAERTTVPLNPRNSTTFTIAWEKEGVARFGFETFYIGTQTLTGTVTPNPYLRTSPGYVLLGFLVERQFGPVSVFLNGDNVTDRRMTRFQPLVLPSQAPDGRWTTDAWGPLDGWLINLGVRWRLGKEGEDEH
jgi:iron complex outermembrane receptor protein